MSAWERLKLSPFQKWKFYGLPPWKFILSILLIISTTVTIYELSATITPYSRAQTENWQSMLIPDAGDNAIEYDEVGTETTYYLYTIEDFMSCLESFVKTYYTLNTSVVGNYEYFYDDPSDNMTIQAPKMTLTSYTYPSQIFDPDNQNFDASTTTNTYYLTSYDDYGPFNNESTQLQLIHSLISMTLQFDVQNIGYSNGYRTCYVDTVSENYDFYFRGRIQLTMNPSVYLCSQQYKRSIFDRQIIVLVIFLIITGILSLVLQFLHIKAVFKHISIFQLAKSKSRDKFHHLTLSDKCEFFNLWFITTTIANVSNIIGTIWVCSLVLIESSGYSWNAPLFFIGFGCMFSWISAIQYFEMFPRYYALILTLRKSAPRVLAFLVGVTPVFLGFAYFGVAYFSTGSPLFSNVDQSCVALFALLNGDVIHDVFDNIYPISPILSRIYLYTFISLFIYAVLNIFIAIVEDAFFAAKQETEIEIDEDLKQQKFDIDELDVVGLVAGPPVPIKATYNNVKDDNVGINHYESPQVVSSKSKRQNEFEESLLSVTKRKDHLSKSEQILLQTHDDPNVSARQHRHEMFLKILNQLISSYNKQFLNDIKSMLMTVETELRPPHSFDNYPCGFNDCIYCHLKGLLQSNLQSLRDNVGESIERTINAQKSGKESKRSMNNTKYKSLLDTELNDNDDGTEEEVPLHTEHAAEDSNNDK